jgi:hypothetical protein
VASLSVRLIELPVRSDARGTLVPIEGASTIPFEIRRTYFMYGMPVQARRGAHAHWRTSQAAICLHGACSFLLDNGAESATVRLDRPSAALLVEPMVWHEMFDFTADCVLLMLADTHFDAADYFNDRALLRGKGS